MSENDWYKWLDIGLSKGNGIYKHKLYYRWINMIRSSFGLNPMAFNFDKYGISVCDRWLYGEDGVHPFTCFIMDMGEPKPNQILWRIDSKKGYTPKNCTWAYRVGQPIKGRGAAPDFTEAEFDAAFTVAEQHPI